MALTTLRWALFYLLLFFQLLACSNGGQITSQSLDGDGTEISPTPPAWNTPGTRYLIGYGNKTTPDASIFSTQVVTGLLAPQADSPLSTGSSPSQGHPDITPDGKCWFFSTQTQGFSGYRYNSKFNAFTALPTNPVLNDGLHSVQTSVDPQNRYLFALRNGWIYPFTLDSNCNPTAIAGAEVSIPTAQKIFAEAGGKYLFILTSAGEMQRYDIQFDGSLIFGATRPLTTAASTSYDMTAFDGHLLFVTSYDGNEVETIKYDSAGQMSSSGKQNTEAGPRAPALSGDGQFLYVVNKTAGTLSIFSVQSVSGTLNPITGSPFNVGSSPSSVATLPGTQLLFVAYEKGVGNLVVYGLSATGLPNSTPLMTYTMASQASGLIAQKVSY